MGEGAVEFACEGPCSGVQAHDRGKKGGKIIEKSDSKEGFEETYIWVPRVLQVGAVDCTVHTSVCQEYGVNGYPTIKFFGSDKRRPLEYQGGRDSGSLTAFALSQWATKQPPPEASPPRSFPSHPHIYSLFFARKENKYAKWNLENYTYIHVSPIHIKQRHSRLL